MLIFDFYTLEKVTELFVNVCNSALADNGNYEEHKDLHQVILILISSFPIFLIYLFNDFSK